MESFFYQGEVVSSQALMLRALIVQSYYPEINVVGHSPFTDVEILKKALAHLNAQEPIDCGGSPTVFRFMALRASRVPGRHVLVGSEAMMKQQQSDFLPMASQLSVQIERGQRHMTLISNGWRLIVDGLHIHSQRCNQLASALILNSSELPYPLHFHIGRNQSGEGHLRMTLQMMRKLGLRVEANGSEYFIPARQILKPQHLSVEPDMPTAFFLSALATVAGRALLSNFPMFSLQPEYLFVNFLKSMNGKIEQRSNQLVVEQASDLRGGVVSLDAAPDLFPLVAVLCALAQSPSLVLGVGLRKFPDVSRLVRSKELLGHMGAVVVAKEDRVEVIPTRERDVTGFSTVFNTGGEARLMMAVKIAQEAGFPIIMDEMTKLDTTKIQNYFPSFGGEP